MFDEITAALQPYTDDDGLAATAAVVRATLQSRWRYERIGSAESLQQWRYRHCHAPGDVHVSQVYTLRQPPILH
jgi:hypothetical protein